MNINLNMRYPESRQEDITDAFTRGYTEAVEASNNAIKKLEEENAKLRELVRDMWHDGMCECDERGACAECEYHFPDRMRELRVEVDE